MARPLRYSEPWQPVEITARTAQGQFLLEPSKRLNALIAGILAKARARYDIHLYNYVFLSNHFHLLAAAASPRVLSATMGFVMGNIAREAGRLYGRSGPFWARRHRSIPIIDDAALIGRMRYLFENGCKEGLVPHPALWPGLNAVEALTKGTPTEGLWVDRTAFYRARQRGRLDLCEDHFTSRHVLTPDPLPCWSGLPIEQQQALCAELVADAAKAAPKKRIRGGYRRPETPRSPHHRPKKVKKSYAPLCHASNREGRTCFRDAYRAFVNAYREASAQLREALPSLGYPTHAQVLAYAASGYG